VDGRQSVRIHGRDVPVHARVEQLESMSAHADASEIMRWLGGFSRPPKKVFIVHGEHVAMDALAGRIRTLPGWTAHMPQHGEVVRLEA
jgi:metallo-beta-lactamase family protein